MCNEPLHVAYAFNTWGWGILYSGFIWAHGVYPTAKIYINEKGKITAVCKEYASVGNGEFAEVITLD